MLHLVKYVTILWFVVRLGVGGMEEGGGGFGEKLRFGGASRLGRDVKLGGAFRVAIEYTGDDVVGMVNDIENGTSRAARVRFNIRVISRLLRKCVRLNGVGNMYAIVELRKCRRDGDKWPN